jgi:hypothetical protein
MYRRTMQIAVAELRRAARTANALEKLQALEVAEQKLGDALWLSPSEERKERFEAGVSEIQRSRARTLEGTVTAVGRLLEAADPESDERAPLLEAAGQLLCFLNHYLSDDPAVDVLSAKYRGLGGRQPEHRPITPLSEIYRRPEGGIGCGAMIGGLLLLLAAVCAALHMIVA